MDYRKLFSLGTWYRLFGRIQSIKSGRSERSAGPGTLEGDGRAGGEAAKGDAAAMGNIFVAY